MVNMGINNLHPDSVSVSVVAYTLDKTLMDILSGTGVVVPNKISELEVFVHSEVTRVFKDYHINEGSIKTEIIFDQDIVEVKVFRLKGIFSEHLFSITADRWKKRKKE